MNNVYILSVACSQSHQYFTLTLFFALCSFSLITVRLYDFLAKGYRQKSAHKMLMKLTPEVVGCISVSLDYRYVNTVKAAVGKFVRFFVTLRYF